jgi:hypothetical protein
MQKYALKKFNWLNYYKCHETNVVLTEHIMRSTRINMQMYINLCSSNN